jgi:hypothetical protein
MFGQTAFVWFLLLLFFAIYICGTILYAYYARDTSNPGLVWGMYALVTTIVVLLVASSLVYVHKRKHQKLRDVQQEFLTQLQESKTMPACSQTERQQCLETAIHRVNADAKHRTALEKIVADNPDDQVAKQELVHAITDLQSDIKSMSACDKLSATNNCLESIADTCERYVERKSKILKDPVLLSQFRELRQTATMPELLNFCNATIH